MTCGERARHPAGTVTRLAAIPPHALVLISIISIQLGAAFSVTLFDTLPPITVVFARLALAALLLAIVIRPSVRTHLRRNWRLLLVYGATLAVLNACFYEAISRIPLGIAVAIEFMGPLAVGVATSRRAQDFAWIALALAGLALLTPEIGAGLDPLGIMFAIISGTAWAGFVVLSQKIGKRIPGPDSLVIGIAVAALILAPLGAPTAVSVVHQLGDAGAFLGLALSILAIAVLSTAIPFFFEFTALQRMSAVVYGVLITLEPVVATIIGAIALADWPGPLALTAILCVTIAAAGASLTKRSEV
ncbi:MAG: EamA family transporter [Pseudomonadota bacterium]